MATGRVTQEEQMQIIKHICEPLQKEVEMKAGDIVTYINNFIKTVVPDEIWLFMEKYPGLIGTNSYISSHELTDNGLLDKVRFNGVERYPRNFFKDNSLVDVIKKDEYWKPNFKILIESLCQVETKRRAMEGKTQCILQTLNTRKKLREGFPEAYKILVEKVEKGVLGTIETLCDSVENLRAELSQYNKK